MNSTYIKEDEWLSNIMGKSAFIVFPSIEFLKAVHNDGSEENKWLQKIHNMPCFVFCKVIPTETEVIVGLEEIGFNLIDTNVTLVNNTLKEFIDSKYKFCFAEKEDKKDTIELAATSFVYSRFHLDHRVSNNVANKVKELWVENFFNGKRGSHMVLAKDGDRIIGFLQIIAQEEQYIIDLIAVSKDYRKQGIAKNLILFANANLENIEKVIVGTQIANMPSINLYEKLGFRFKSAKYVFHYDKN
jgi:ribosomal protein S18 acetylase RimI-like enzyme